MIKRLLSSRLAWALLSTALRVGGALLILPIVLRRIPEAQMEIWWLFVTVQALAIQVDFGLGPSISRGLSYMLTGATSLKPDASSVKRQVDPVRIGSFIESTRTVYHWVVLSGFIILSLASFFVVPKIIQLGGGGWFVFSWALFAIGILISISSARQMNLLTGADHVRLSQQIQLCCTLANLVLTVLGLSFGLEFQALAIGSFVSGAVQWFLGHYFLKRYLDNYLNTETIEQASQLLKEIWPTAWRTGLVSLGAYLIYNSNVFWASANLGQPIASRYPLTLKFMQLLVTVCGLPVMTQTPKIAKMIASGESAEAWKFFLRRHLLGLSAMIVGVFFLWLLGDWILAEMGSQSRLLGGPFLLFMGLIYVLEFNHGYCAIYVMTRNEVPFVWAATVSGVAICIGGGIFSRSYGLWGLLGTVFIVQAAWNNWWVPLLAYRYRK